MGEAMSVNALGVPELVPPLKENNWNQLFTIAVLSDEDTVVSSIVDSQMAALRKDGSRHDNGSVLIACDQ